MLVCSCLCTCVYIVACTLVDVIAIAPIALGQYMILIIICDAGVASSSILFQWNCLIMMYVLLLSVCASYMYRVFKPWAGEDCSYIHPYESAPSTFVTWSVALIVGLATAYLMI